MRYEYPKDMSSTKKEIKESDRKAERIFKSILYFLLGIAMGQITIAIYNILK